MHQQNLICVRDSEKKWTVIFVFMLGVFMLGATAALGATRARFTAETTLNDPTVRISTGNAHTCQVREDGSARCWGANDSQQLGFSGPNTANPGILPSAVFGTLAIASGFQHTCALLFDGPVQCWGSNQSGQHGANTNPANTVWERVSGITNAVAISAGDNHTCALLAEGTVRCWGANPEGQLGDGTQTNRTVPVAVLGLSDVVAISAGGNHTCAVMADGTAKCWGQNSNGELGDITRTRRLTPVQVQGLSRVVAIASGGSHTCALVNGSSEGAFSAVRCWGGNVFGALGNNSLASSLFPDGVVGLVRPVAIAAGALHTCALLADGTARCWGWNHDGQIGNGRTTDLSQPQPLSGTGHRQRGFDRGRRASHLRGSCRRVNEVLGLRR